MTRRVLLCSLYLDSKSGSEGTFGGTEGSWKGDLGVTSGSLLRIRGHRTCRTEDGASCLFSYRFGTEVS